MSVRIYLKRGVTKNEVPESTHYENGGRAYLWPMSIHFKNLMDLDLTYVKHFDYLTIEEDFWKEMSGFCFTPGMYAGEGFEVSISPSSVSNRGSEKNGFRDWRQTVFGRFNSPEVAITFWNALTRGEILPTRPLCREITLTEQAYAKQASTAVALTARLSAQEALIAQLFVHIREQGQIIQDRVLTPRT